jgi:hypothetical protein
MPLKMYSHSGLVLIFSRSNAPAYNRFTEFGQLEAGVRTRVQSQNCDAYVCQRRTFVRV